MRRPRAILAGAWAVAALCAAVWGADLRVDGRADPNGDGSPARPFGTIGAAMKAARPGDIISVKAGVYHEVVRLPSGEPNRPIVLRAEANQRVVLSGGRRVEGWKKWPGGVWVARVESRPAKFFVDLAPRPVARTPAEGWWVAESATETSLTDSRNLPGLKGDPVGCGALVWTQVSYGTYQADVRGLDREGGTITIVNPEDKMRLYAGDRYCLRGCPDNLREGEWGFRDGNGATDLYYRPAKEAELEAVEVPAVKTPLVNGEGAHDVTVEGLEIVAGDGPAIHLSKAARVVITRCVVRDGGGIGVSGGQDVAIRRNLVVGCRRSCISVADSNRVTVEENELRNEGMGVSVGGRAEDVLVRRNAIRGVPGSQGEQYAVYVSGEITGIRVIENLGLHQREGIWFRGSRGGGEVRGNMLIGSMGGLINLSPWPDSIEVRGNTAGYSLGYSPSVLAAGHGHSLFGNVFVSGSDRPVYSLAEANAVRSDRNLFWDASLAKSPFVSAKGGHPRLDGFQEATGQDGNSLYADPALRSAPAFLRAMDGKRIQDCTRTKWYIFNGTGGFLVGDRVEAAFDGQLHKIVSADAESITVEPGLAAAPEFPLMVANWRDRAEARLDLRLGEKSPGLTLGEGGRPVGSPIDAQAFLRGDFDGDGRRDVPELPGDHPAALPGR